MGTTSLEDVAAASEGSPLLIFQLYVQRDREFTASLIRSKLIMICCVYALLKECCRIEGKRMLTCIDFGFADLLTPCCLATEAPFAVTLKHFSVGGRSREGWIWCHHGHCRFSPSGQ